MTETSDEYLAGIMKGRTLNEQNAERRDLAAEAKQRLEAGEFSSERERQRLIHEAAPWHTPGKSHLGGLRVVFDPESQSMMLFDYGGFLTCVATPNTLWELLMYEATAPGYNRARLAKDALPDTALYLKMAEQAKQAATEPKVRKFTETGKEKMTLEDLDL